MLGSELHNPRTKYDPIQNEARILGDRLFGNPTQPNAPTTSLNLPTS